MLVNDVTKAETTTKKEPWDYWLLKGYDGIILENKGKLICRVKKASMLSSFASEILKHLTKFTTLIWPLTMKDRTEC